MGQGCSNDSFDISGVPVLQKELQAWKTNCANGIQDLTSPLACSSAALSQLEPVVQLNVISANWCLIWSYATCRQNIVDLCDWNGKSYEEQDALVWKVFPAFYWMYNSDTGKRMVDALVTEMGNALPQKAVDMIKRNYEDWVQRRFMLMNSYVGYVEGSSRWSPGRVAVFSVVGPFCAQAIEIGILDKLSRPIPCKTTLMDQNKIRSGMYKDVVDSVMLGRNGAKWFYSEDNEGYHLIDPGGWGNPFWSYEKRAEALRAIMPVNQSGENFLDVWTKMGIEAGYLNEKCTYETCFNPKPEAGKANPYNDDPIYGGNLPGLVVAANPFNFPGGAETLSGGAGSTWTNPCDDRGLLEKVMPYAAAIFAGAVLKIFLPAGKSTWVLVGAAAGTGYFVGQTLYGLDANLNLFTGDQTNSGAAATIVTTVGTAGGVYFLHEQRILQFFNINLTDYTALGVALGSAVISFYYLHDAVKIALTVGGGIASIITAPLSFLESFILFASNGCLAQEFKVALECTCKEANLTGGKSGIREKWLTDIYGTTKQQATMRRECLKLEMSRGGWASTDRKDDNVVSRCTGVVMENPFACETAHNWAYRNVIAGYEMTHPQQIDMWNQVSHCLDSGNPSFLPLNPNASTYQLDKYCQAKHGEHFRAGPNGTCKNFALPGPNNTDPVGLQDPGAYTEKSSGGSWCSIQ